MAAPDNAHAKLDAILDEEEEGAGMQVDATGDEAALYGEVSLSSSNDVWRLQTEEAHNLPPATPKTNPK